MPRIALKLDFPELFLQFPTWPQFRAEPISRITAGLSEQRCSGKLAEADLSALKLTAAKSHLQTLMIDILGFNQTTTRVLEYHQQRSLCVVNFLKLGL